VRTEEWIRVGERPAHRSIEGGTAGALHTQERRGETVGALHAEEWRGAQQALCTR